MASQAPHRTSPAAAPDADVPTMAADPQSLPTMAAGTGEFEDALPTMTADPDTLEELLEEGPTRHFERESSSSWSVPSHGLHEPTRVEEEPAPHYRTTREGLLDQTQVESIDAPPQAPSWSTPRQDALEEPDAPTIQRPASRGRAPQGQPPQGQPQQQRRLQQRQPPRPQRFATRPPAPEPDDVPFASLSDPEPRDDEIDQSDLMLGNPEQAARFASFDQYQPQEESPSEGSELQIGSFDGPQDLFALAGEEDHPPNSPTTSSASRGSTPRRGRTRDRPLLLPRQPNPPPRGGWASTARRPITRA